MIETRTSLIHRVCNPDDEESWGEFVALYEPLLMAYVRKQGLGEHDARDAMQNLFVILLRSLAKYDRTRGRFRTWLWKVMYNVVVDWKRGQQRHRGIDADYTFDALPAANTPEPEAAWELDHRQRVLSFAINRVREAVRPDMWASFEEHLLKKRPSSDVASELGITKNAVYVNTSRMLAKVRDKCAEFEEELADA